ncbi:MarR family winged helix-turn-helix transcriptional regulator [Paracoccus sp. JM45]|uniref:MarR family winged helix-turn-helix transcriptional regulator n=1 Tax=Paracoccus sp. JM45 TaxID=2283626 RepID=UPI000E6D42EE|nr:MarR family winged helix-turn-helix transcriptional regulator [Paracoccus sp. JM45]RJE78998.1 MarR family transcriptional regulator [Paracoccus sp. JM45]
MSETLQGAGFHLLLHSTHLLDEHLRELLKPFDLHPGQARFIHALGRLKEASQRHLASEFNVTPASMSQMTKRLIANGFIQMRHDPKDKRATLLSLSDKGWHLRDQVLEVWQQVDRIICNAIGPENAEQLFLQSGRLRDSIGGRAPLTKHGKLSGHQQS